MISDQLAFERDWVQFRIPSMLRSFQSIQAEVLNDMGVKTGDYEYFLRRLNAAFLPAGIAELDEYGLPIPLGLKLLGTKNSENDTVIDRLKQLLEMRLDPSTHLDNVELWIVDDVLEGYFGPTWRKAEPEHADVHMPPLG